MSEPIKQNAQVFLRRQNETVEVSMHCTIQGGSNGFSVSICRRGGSLFYGNQEIKGNLYDFMKKSVESYFKGWSNDSQEVKLLNFPKPEGDILDMVKYVFCEGKEYSYPVEYEVHVLNEKLFDCKDCG